MYKSAKHFYRKLLDFKTADRGDYVVYLILLVFTGVASACTIGMIINKVILGDQYHGAPIYLSFVLTALMIFGTTLFRRGYTKLVDSIFLFFLLLIYTNIVLNSGSENEFAILLMVIYIIVAAITLRGKYFSISFLVLFLTFLTLNTLEIEGISLPNLVNRTNFGNTAGTLIILSMIVFISWLFNHEINSYIAQLEQSKKLLKKEKELLEIRVAERTEQLRLEQAEKLAEFSRFAEFGRLSQGLYHDLMNPLTALSLNLNLIKNGKKKQLDQLSQYIEGATIAANNMEKLISSTQDYLRKKNEKTSFSILQELDDLQKLIHFKAKKEGVKLIFQKENDLTIFGDRTKFSRLLGNLTLNAIEAYHGKKDQALSKEIAVSFSKEKNMVVIKVKDNACGMKPEVRDKIFQPFFSTKEEKGNTGIGLSTCKDIVETDFLGTISVHSEHGHGAEFVISIPQEPLR